MLSKSWLASVALSLSFVAAAQTPIPVTTSFSILADLVHVVGGDRVAVTPLVGPDEDAHVFEPKPADAKAILQSKLVVTNGLGFEPWMGKLVKSAGYKGASVIASTGVVPRKMDEDGHTITDPHAWQNPANVIFYVNNISKALSQLDPAGAATYQANSAAYVAELQTLDAWAKTQFTSVPVDKRKVITSHDAFGYFAAHYQLKFLAPQGMSTEGEASAKEVASLVRQIKREKIKAVFLENMSNPKLLEQLSKEAGVTPGATLYADALSAPGQPGATYLQMARHNVTALVTGLQQN
ncbi:metal ABC transporter substrate-binding protein [Rhodoferax sp.]|uniref:metal ABC transporter substrate-binding protein n=1 Tax=Rhodoferax sp. TaxID=50421 RepID=UPI00374CC77C